METRISVGHALEKDTRHVVETPTRPNALGKSDPFCGPSNPRYLFTKYYTIFCKPSHRQHLFTKDWVKFFTARGSAGSSGSAGGEGEKLEVPEVPGVRGKCSKCQKCRG